MGNLNVFRRVQYLGDGVDEYQCLACKKKFHAWGGPCNWKFCPLCGVRFEGLANCRPHRVPRWAYDLYYEECFKECEEYEECFRHEEAVGLVCDKIPRTKGLVSSKRWRILRLCEFTKRWIELNNFEHDPTGLENWKRAWDRRFWYSDPEEDEIRVILTDHSV